MAQSSKKMVIFAALIANMLIAITKFIAAAISLADHALPFESVLLAMLIEQQHQIEQLQAQLHAR